MRKTPKKQGVLISFSIKSPLLYRLSYASLGLLKIL
jgi:hypothetical protein